MLHGFFFFLLGFFSIISQAIILRTIILFFYGNEFFLGIVLAIWLLGVALGSFFAQKLSKKFFLFSLLFLIFYFPFFLFLSAFLRSRIFIQGEIPSLGFSLITLFPLLTIFCLFLGSSFTLGVKHFTKKENIVAKAYLLETLGMAIGGILFSLILVNLPLPFERNLLSLSYPNLVEFKNTPYGKIIITKSGGQYNFFETGSLIGTTNDHEINEYFYHTVFSLNNNPKKVLLIGGGLTGGITEILKYPIEKLDYVELDQTLVEVIKKYLPENLKQSFSDSRLKIHLIDGRRFVTHPQGKTYDLIIFNLPSPSTFLINRFYTKEVFGEVKNLLSKNGIFVTSLFLPVDYLSSEATMVGGSVYKSLKSTFPYVFVLPTEEIIFLASNQKFLIIEEKIKEKWQNLDIKTYYFTPEYIFSNLKTPRVKQIYNLLSNSPAKTNSDFLPSAVFYQTAFWQTYFSFYLAKIQSLITKPIFQLLTPFLLLVTCYLLLKKIPGENLSPIISVFLSGFTLMSLGLLILYLYQVKIGYLYSQIVLLMGVILGAYGMGIYLINSKLQIINSKQSSKSKFPNTKNKFEVFDFNNLNLFGIWNLRFGAFYRPYFIIKVAFSLLTLLSFFLLLTMGQWNYQVIFYFFGSLVGFFCGFVFPSASKIYFKDKKADAGTLYTADLLGSLFGSLFPTIFWLPVLGVPKTILIILFLLFIFLLLFLKNLGSINI